MTKTNEVPTAYQCRKCEKIYHNNTAAQECFDSHVHPKLTSLDTEFEDGGKYPNAVFIKMADNRVIRYIKEED